jgi:hypothetical protein
MGIPDKHTYTQTKQQDDLINFLKKYRGIYRQKEGPTNRQHGDSISFLIKYREVYIDRRKDEQTDSKLIS